MRPSARYLIQFPLALCSFRGTTGEHGEFSRLSFALVYKVVVLFASRIGLLIPRQALSEDDVDFYVLAM